MMALVDRPDQPSSRGPVDATSAPMPTDAPPLPSLAARLQPARTAEELPPVKIDVSGMNFYYGTSTR